MASKHIGNLLNPSNNAELAKSLKRSAEIGRLTADLSEALPAEMASAILSASVGDDKVLCLRVSSSAWASRLRFETERLEAAARKAGVEISGVNVRVGRTDQA